MAANDEITEFNTTSDRGLNNMDDDDNDDLLLLSDALSLNTSSLRSEEKYAGFDNNAAENWIYPSNFAERAYQFNIVQKALFHNTLVVLPTGLGKTFIAAVVMYNIYRWYPMGKVIFMAPTRPLVAQQIDACCKTVGISKTDSVEITGKLSKATRSQLWRSKRVFFATPQSVQSDIFDVELDFPFKSVKLIVVDEAHRAKGRYAYTEVIRYILSKNKFVRILALSATPGRRKEDVEEVIRNLFISKLEVRTEDSVDVVSYVHKRQLKVVVVDLGTKLSQIRDELLRIADPHIRNLMDNRLISGNPNSISKNWLVMEHKRFREMTQNSGVPYQKELNSDFNICISVYHAIGLIERHGIRVFLNNFDEHQEGGPKFALIQRPDLRRLVQKVREDVGPDPFAVSDECMLNGQIAPIPPNIDFGHPKFEIAREHVVAHFENNKEARVIIFCEYRESVMLMHRLLLQHRPLIRPRLFVGQGGTGSIRAVTQQQQISVMNDFKSGKSNALIATSVAEEGIDVGEVDLIVCFDINTSNPTRFIQRIGRTGRKKDGKVLLLATEGKEHSMLRDVLSERNRLNKSISQKGQFSEAFYKQAPRMVPTEFNPKCLKVFIPAPQSEEVRPNNKFKKKTKGNKFAQLCQKKDMRHFLKHKTNDDDDNAVFANSEVPMNTGPQKNLSTSKCESFTEASLSTTNNVTLHETSSNTLPISPSFPSKTININLKLIKKMGKFIRNTATKPTTEALKAIASNKLSKDGIIFLINSNSDTLLNIWLRMQELWERGINENNLPLKGVTTDDRQVARVYNQIISHVGSKEAFAELVERKQKLPNFNDKYASVFENVQHGGINTNNFEFLFEKFEEITSDFPSDIFSKHSYVKSMIYDDEIDEVDRTSMDFNESSINYDNDMAYESKYRSQIMRNTKNTSTHESDDDVIFVGTTTHQSTPIRSQKKSLLNFTETPIMAPNAKRVSAKLSHEKKRQTNILHFMYSNMGPSIETVPSKTINTDTIEANQNKCPEEDHEIPMEFFEDQFDALIAENSGIIESIESNNQANCNPKPLDSNKTVMNSTSSLNVISSSQRSVQNQTSQTETKRDNNEIHPELADIDFNDLSDLSFGENDDHFKNDSAVAATTIAHRSSPDIFEELFETSSKPQGKEDSPLKIITSESRATTSPCIVSKKALTWKEIREKYIKPTASEKLQDTTTRNEEVAIPESKNASIRNATQNDSPIHVSSKIRSKRRIIVSDSDSSSDEESSQARKKPKPLSQKQQEVSHLQPVPSSSAKYGLFRKKNNEFVDDEAKLSGSASEDELEHTVGHYIHDSVVVNDDEVENESSIPMTGIYLRSIRSPQGNIRGGFKIPQRRVYNDTSKIYSQRVSPDNGSYAADSFVVVSDEESDAEQSMCPLERAEEILKMKRRQKYKTLECQPIKEVLQPMKRKRVLRIHNSSEDDDFV